jgi:hypothetical protein
MNTESRKIRVCFVNPKAYPLFNPDIQKVFGGAEVDFICWATELETNKRFEVQFVCDYGQRGKSGGSDRCTNRFERPNHDGRRLEGAGAKQATLIVYAMGLLAGDDCLSRLLQSV